jgi:hypothetical protein
MMALHPLARRVAAALTFALLLGGGEGLAQDPTSSPGMPPGMPDRLQGSPYLPPTKTGPTLHVEVSPYDTPAPIPDVDALVFLEGRPGELFSCMAGAFVDEFGQVKEVFTRGCPIAFRNTALDTMRRWRFNVPTMAGRATTGRYEVELIFVGSSVMGQTPIPAGAVLVRAEPMAIPLWPSPPKLRAKSRAWLDDQGLDGYRCKIRLQVDDMGAPQHINVVDCPGPLHVDVLRRAQRYGFDVIGATRGDGTVYTLDLWLDAADPG